MMTKKVNILPLTNTEVYLFNRKKMIFSSMYKKLEKKCNISKSHQSVFTFHSLHYFLLSFEINFQ